MIKLKQKPKTKQKEKQNNNNNNKKTHNLSILDIHFSYPTKINTNEVFFFFNIFRNNIMPTTLYQKYKSLRVPHKRELIDL